jgi:hypothetical protein
MRQVIFILCLSLSLLTASGLYAQSASQQLAYPSASPQPASPSGLQLPSASPTPVYPQTKAYLSFIIPWVTVQGKTATPEFKTATTIGFPFGILVLYSATFGFSFEITPSIMYEHQTAKSPASKTSNVLFDPGPMFRFQHGWTFIPRLAFETGGRYGVTPVLNKTVLRTKALNYFVAVSTPMRAGNSEPTSIGANLQIGCIFN